MHELVKNNIKKIFNKVGGASKESQCWDEHDICISVPFMRDTTRARARKYGKDAGLSPSSTHVRQ